MVRNITGFAVFAFVAMMAFKLLTSVFGALIGLVLTLLWWGFLGFVIYTILKIFSPSTAQKVRETIRGSSAPAA
jgi:predicted lipid-binding transport protein (Tim44 family)